MLWRHQPLTSCTARADDVFNIMTSGCEREQTVCYGVQAYAVVIAWTAGSAVRRRQSVAAQQLLANQGNYKANRRGWHPFRVARRSQARICAAGPRLAACRIVCSVIRPTIVEVLTGYAAVARAWEGLLAAAIAAGDGEAAKIGDGDDSAGDGAAAAVAGEGAGAGAADTGDGSAVAVAPFVKSMVPPGTALLGCAATASSVMVKSERVLLREAL